MSKTPAKKSATENVDPDTRNIHKMNALQSLTVLWKKQVQSVKVIKSALSMIAASVDKCASVLSRTKTGRIFYIGAGTSERMGNQDGAELYPTFGFPKKRVVQLGAGGPRGARTAIEGAEDSVENAINRLAKYNIGPDDVVMLISASGNAPYVVAACKFAREAGATTVGISNNPGSQLLQAAEFPILSETGAEPIAGSTRMNAGTSDTAILKMWSTTLMIKMGRTYRNKMVCMIPSNNKLRIRARDMVIDIARDFHVACSPAKAAKALQQTKTLLGAKETDQTIRLATVMAFGPSAEKAHSILEQHQYHLGPAIESLGFKAQDLEL